MLTVITLEELEKLHRDYKLGESDNSEVLSQDVLALMDEVYKEKTEQSLGNVLYLKSAEGISLDEVDASVLENQHGEVLGFLPQLEGTQICLVVKTPKDFVEFSDTTMGELEELVALTEEEKEFYKEVLTSSIEDSESCIYAVSGELKLEDVVGILYPPEVEEDILKIKEDGQKRGVLFKSTSVFD